MARWQDEHWESGRDDRAWRERMGPGDRGRDERYGRDWRGEDRDRWRMGSEDSRSGEGRFGGEYGGEWDRFRGMRDEPGREGWRGAESRQWQSGRGEYTSYGSGGGRDWARDEGHGRGDYGSRGEYGGRREPAGYGAYGRESAGTGGYGRELGYGAGGLGAATYRGSSADRGYGEHERHGGYGGYGGRDYGSREYGREFGGYEGREDDRGPLERLGDRFREGMRHLTGKGPKGFHRSDERIRDDVCERIARSGLDAEDVEVKVEHGEVTLSGTVRHRDDKRRLEDVAEEVFGVEEVHNTIRVRREEQRWGTGQTIASSGQTQATQGQQGGQAQGGQRAQGTSGTSATTSQPGAHSR